MSNEFVPLRRDALNQVLNAMEEIECVFEQIGGSFKPSWNAMVQSLRAALEHPVQEPVAWIRGSGKAMLEVSGYCTVYASEGMSTHSTPLYTAPQPAQQPEADKLLRQALEAMEVQGSEWVILERNAIAAIRKYFGEA